VISIVIPSKNEPRLREVVSICNQLYPEFQIIISHDPEGRGKGWALRQGVRKAEHNFIAFLDGDMDIHPAMLMRLIPFLPEYDVIVGYKPLSGTFKRKLLTFLSRLYIKTLFGLNVDTQTGIKLLAYMAKIEITHTRQEVTITKYTKVCPYCKKKPIKRVTCGDWICQWKHHILEMRKDRKTEQVRTTRIKI